MPSIEMNWTWRLTSAGHPGSGLSNPSVADRLITRDASGRPIVHGEVVKGALRMAAEQLADWLVPADTTGGTAVHLSEGRKDRYRSQETAEPISWPMAYAFGDAGQSHVSPARLTCHSPREDEAAPANETLSVASTAINPATGTAEDQTLRITELLASGATLNATWSVWVPDDKERQEIVETLLVAALCACESIGANATAGVGRVSIDDVTGVDPVRALDPSRLEKLQNALKLGEKASFRTSLPALARTPTTAVQWYRLHIVLDEPCCFGQGPEISNHVRTSMELPATTLRGAIAAHWRRAGASPQDIADRLSDATCWSPGFPAIDGEPLLPAPRSLLRAKRGSEVDDVTDAFVKSAPTGVKRGPMDGTWVRLEPGGISCFDPATLAQMHVARDYATGSKVHGALYSRESLVPGQTEFVAFVRATSDCFMRSELPSTSFEVRLGKRTSAGNGQARVAVTRIGGADIYPFGAPADNAGGGDSQVLLIHALSPILVRDPGTGWPLRALGPREWCRLLHLGDDDLKTPKDDRPSALAIATRRAGWMIPWGHGRATVSAIAPGSVWRLSASEEGLARRILASPVLQVGERIHEGFGWIAVSTVPSHGHARKAGSLRHQDSEPGRQKWPGAATLDDAVVDKLIEDVPASVSADAAGPLHHLLARARDARTAQDVIHLRDECHQWSTRQRPGQWKSLAPDEALGRYLSPVWGQHDTTGTFDPVRVRFALELLAIRASTPARTSTGAPS